MSEVKRLVYSFIQFLGDQLSSGVLSPDAAESLEVAIQCLESAYGIDHATTEGGRSPLAVSRPLLEIFSNATENEPANAVIRASVAPFLKNYHHRWRTYTSDDRSSSGVMKIEGRNDYDDEVDGRQNGEIEEDEEDEEEDEEEEEDTDDEDDGYNRRTVAVRYEREDGKIHSSNGETTAEGGGGGGKNHSCKVCVHRSPCSEEPLPLDLSLVRGLNDSGGGGSEMQQIEEIRRQQAEWHQLDRMPPKGGCVQCGKEGRVTKRGRPHESYFGCRSCKVHLCRKRDCFEIFHASRFGMLQSSSSSSVVRNPEVEMTSMVVDSRLDSCSPPSLISSHENTREFDVIKSFT